MGRLVMDPEESEFQNGKNKVQFSLETTDFTFNKKGEKVKDTQLHNIVAWDKLARFASHYLKKGRVIAVVGKLNNRKFEDAKGQYRYRTEIVVNELLMLDNQN